jgi:hypothetical protein
MNKLIDFLIRHAHIDPFNALNALAQIVLALIALFALIYAILQYRLTKTRYAEENRPYVTIELERVTSGLLDLVIRNSGNSAAKNINIKFTPNIAIYEHTKSKINSHKFLKNMKFLASGKSLSFFFGSVLGGKTKICREFQIAITYEDVTGKTYHDDQTIDPRDFLELVSITRKDIHDAAKSLDEIKKELNSSNKNSEKILGHLEKGLISRDSSFNELALNDLLTALKNILTIGVEEVHNTYPMERDAEIIAKIARNRLITKTNLTPKEQRILKVLNKFESSNYDYETQVIVDEYLKAIE